MKFPRHDRKFDFDPHELRAEQRPSKEKVLNDLRRAHVGGGLGYQAHDAIEAAITFLECSSDEPPAALDRYSIELHGEVCGPVIRKTLDPNGEWVLYEDVASYLRPAPPPEAVSHSDNPHVVTEYQRGFDDGFRRATEGFTQPPAPEWRPIETAPKDGSDLLLAKIVGHIDHATAVWWMVKGSWSPKWNKWWDGIEPCGLSGPTHWMPIPRRLAQTKCEGPK